MKLFFPYLLVSTSWLLFFVLGGGLLFLLRKLIKKSRIIEGSSGENLRLGWLVALFNFLLVLACSNGLFFERLPENHVAKMVFIIFFLSVMFFGYFFAKRQWLTEKIFLFVLGSIFLLTVFWVKINFSLQYPFLVKGDSMSPAFNDGDYVFSKLKNKVTDFSRGDIIIHQASLDKKVVIVRRIIGVPGDLIKIEESKIYVNDQLEREGNFSIPQKVQLGKDQFYVLTDKNDDMFDSRIFGLVDFDQIYAKVVFKIN